MPRRTTASGTMFFSAKPVLLFVVVVVVVVVGFFFFFFFFFLVNQTKPHCQIRNLSYQLLLKSMNQIIVMSFLLQKKYTRQGVSIPLGKQPNSPGFDLILSYLLFLFV
jgi:hypothetical protein